jgi:hypothetical protein
MSQGGRHSFGEKSSVRKTCERVLQCQGFQDLAVSAGRLVQQADFQHVANPHQYLGQIERFADKILRAALQRARLVIGMGCHGQHRHVAVGFDLLQALQIWNPSVPGITRSSRIKS